MSPPVSPATDRALHAVYWGALVLTLLGLAASAAVLWPNLTVQPWTAAACLAPGLALLAYAAATLRRRAVGVLRAGLAGFGAAWSLLAADLVTRVPA